MDSATNMISKGELFAELDMIERKKRNVIVFGLKELEDKNEHSERDKKRVLDLFQDIGADAKVVNYYRVGYPAAVKTRPMVVCLETPESRSAILNLAKQLKNQHKWKKVYLAEDLTKNQYNLDKMRETSLKEEAARRNQQVNKKGILWKVVGGRGTRRIVMVRTD